MFTSKSLLNSITIGRLEFDCTNIAAWLYANPHCVHRWQDMPLPIEQIGLRTTGSVTRLSGGHYGAVFKLEGYPGLILKVCIKADDGYPEYIRSVAVKHAPKWAPKIFAHGGDETTGAFWCVMPAYEEARTSAYCKDYRSEALHMMDTVQDTDYWSDKVGVVRRNEYVRTHRKQIQDLIWPMLEAGALEDMHGGNIMFDPTLGHHIITDPVGRFGVEGKARYRANL